MSSYSTELLARAQMVIPGGVNSPVRAFHGVGGSPIFFKSGKGPFLYDTDDKQYIDYVGSWGPLILGHAHPAVVEAVHRASERGLGFGASTLLEVEMAEMLTNLVPSLEQVRLVCSGTEATQSAIRLARGFTGRDKILKFEGCYHGHVDSLLVKGGSGLLTLGLPDSAGVPKTFTEHTLNVPFNDLEALQQVFEIHGDSIAAVIVEPIAGNMNCIPPLPQFLPKIRELCNRTNSLLIFDEVITGFRVALGGAQDLYSVIPDLTCLGKVMGGGLPIAAFGGRKDIMEQLAPLGPVYQAGTLAGNPVAVAAGLATLKEIEKPGFFDILQHRTQTLLDETTALAAQYSIPFKAHSVGSLFGLLFSEETSIHNYNQVANCNKEHYKHFFHSMARAGVYFAPSAFECGFMSFAHTDAIIDRSIEAIKKVFRTWP